MTGTASGRNAQPAAAEDESSTVPDWRSQLGVVRTDWRWAGRRPGGVGLVLSTAASGAWSLKYFLTFPLSPSAISRQEVEDVYNTPLLELVHLASTVHRQNNDPSMVQRCTLLSIKTGGCPETCNYCSQSSSWSKSTGTKAEKLLALEDVFAAAERAKAAGSTRFCMGAAWRGPSQVGPRQFERVLEMVRRVRGLGMEVCTTLGMLTPDQAAALREAGLTAYNHNLDTSREYYGKVTSSRSYDDRLETIESVRRAGISVCAGGIIGLGEKDADRVGLLRQLATLPAHPESVPINALVAVKGTPFEGHQAPTGLDMVRCIATARVLMPKTVVRLSAGRLTLSFADQALCFLAGANSIFDGDKLLTTPNNERSQDDQLFGVLGLKSRPAFLPYAAGNTSSEADFREPVADGDVVECPRRQAQQAAA